MAAERSTRRRLSASSNIETLGTKDEALGLLSEAEQGEGEVEERSIDVKVRNKGVGADHSKWLQPLNIAFAVLLLLAIALTSTFKLYRSFKYFSDLEIAHNVAQAVASQDEMLGIRLHPRDHVSRDSTTITHFWDITTGLRSPDGVKKQVYLVNDLFPGPTIECRSGDRLIIHVTNNLDSAERVSVHWHGLEMRNATNMDGAVGFTQCSIPATQSFTYDFEVGEDQAGTFWWHAHSQVERGDGMYGGLVVHKPVALGDDMKGYGYEDEVLLMVGDWYHRSAGEVLAWYTSVRGFGNEPVPDSILLNGRGKFGCSMAPLARPVECVDIEERQFPEILSINMTHTSIRLRLVNVGSLAGFTVRVSGATLLPITVDSGFPINGAASDLVGILYPGERVDVLLIWNEEASAKSPRLHISLDPENFKYTNAALQPNQSFRMLAPSTRLSTSPTMPTNNKPFDLASATALNHISLPETAHQTILLYTKTQKLSISSNHPQGFVNRTSWLPQFQPLLSLPRSSWDNNQLIPYIPLSTTPVWVDLIINNLDDGSHPFHLHGHSFYVLASHRSATGWGSYNPYATSGLSSLKPTLNLKDPVKKDTVSVPRRGYVVLRFKADNEGIWMLHCHVLFHQGSGMAMGIHVGREEGHDDVDLSAREMCRGDA